MRNIPPEGPGICTCPISLLGEQPTPWGLNTLDWKCCRHCGFPSVHRMAPHILDRALARMPSLRNQQIAQEAAA